MLDGGNRARGLAVSAGDGGSASLWRSVRPTVPAPSCCPASSSPLTSAASSRRPQCPAAGRSARPDSRTRPAQPSGAVSTTGPAAPDSSAGPGNAMPRARSVRRGTTKGTRSFSGASASLKVRAEACAASHHSSVVLSAPASPRSSTRGGRRAVQFADQQVAEPARHGWDRRRVPVRLQPPVGAVPLDAREAGDLAAGCRLAGVDHAGPHRRDRAHLLDGATVTAARLHRRSPPWSRQASRRHQDRHRTPPSTRRPPSRSPTPRPSRRRAGSGVNRPSLGSPGARCRFPVSVVK
ncbi:hypothetical protein A3Q37_03493 [Streptomyces sp. PTY087I2]|nr:hypothetical protein A3Q37_03493 [Streptomyces sp. PTY087I2]